MAWATDNAIEPWVTDNAAVERLVDDALCSKKAELGLSFYEFKDLRWVIREHLIELVSEFPNFLPSANAYTHKDGKVNELINAKGRLPVLSPIPLPPLHLTLWIPRRYPFVPPVVFFTSPGPDAVLSHPYLDPASGEATAAPYLISWEFPLSNLADLTHSLASAFERNPPFPALCSPRGRIVFEPEEYDPEHLALALVAEQALLSWEDAFHELAMRVQCDVDLVTVDTLEAAEKAKTMRQRWCRVSRAEYDQRHELSELRMAARKMAEHADTLRNWVRFNDTLMFPTESPEDAFEPADEEVSAGSSTSWAVKELEAACSVIDDLLGSLERSVIEKAVSAREYLKQVKSQAREQFFLTAKAKKLAKSIGKVEDRSQTIESSSSRQKPKQGAII